MNAILTQIIEGLQEIFPDMGDMAITSDTELGEIPDWDSMSAVNFQSFVEQNFQVSIPLDILSEENTVGEVISFIEEPDKISETA